MQALLTRQVLLLDPKAKVWMADKEQLARFLTKKVPVRLVDEHTAFIDNLSEDEQAAIKTYQGPQYKEINQYVRDKTLVLFFRKKCTS